MASSYTTNITLEKPEPGEQSGEWGTTLNANFDKIDTKLAIKDEDNMASDSASHLATQQSIKAYVDSQVATEESIEDVVGGMVTGNTETGIAVTYEDGDGTLDFVVSDTTVAGDSGSTGITPGDTLTIAGGTNVTTAMSGDTLTVTATDTNTQLSQEQVEDYVGGMLDGTETFISVSYDDTDGNIDFVVPVLDEDNMSTNSAAHLATQQSIKAYVDTAASTGTRNLIMNGEMRVAQRATSATGIGNGDAGYHVCDRWRFNEGGTIQAEVTMSQDSDVPAGQGFSNSLKLDVTTAESAVAADERFVLDNIIEGQDLTHLKFGTSEAMSLTLSFWIKSTKTGTYCITLYNGSTGIDDRILTKTYTVDSTNTWEKKTLTWVGDTDSGSAFVDDNADGLFVQFWFMAGSNFTDGTLTSSWVDWDDGVWADAMVNALDSTSNNIYLTGVQLEAGSTATEYEHRTFAHELQQCQRYFQTWGRQTTTGIGVGTGNAQNATTAYIFPHTKGDMRATPTITFNGTVNVYDGAAVVTISSIGSMNGDGHGMWMYITTASGLTGKSGAWVYTGTSTSDYLDLSADL